MHVCTSPPASVHLASHLPTSNPPTVPPLQPSPTFAQVGGPRGLAADAEALYVADGGNGRVQRRWLTELATTAAASSADPWPGEALPRVEDPGPMLDMMLERHLGAANACGRLRLPRPLARGPS